MEVIDSTSRSLSVAAKSVLLSGAPENVDLMVLVSASSVPSASPLTTQVPKRLGCFGI